MLLMMIYVCMNAMSVTAVPAACPQGGIELFRQAVSSVTCVDMSLMSILRNWTNTTSIALSTTLV
jgi:hypothetical protein